MYTLLGMLGGATCSKKDAQKEFDRFYEEAHPNNPLNAHKAKQGDVRYNKTKNVLDETHPDRCNYFGNVKKYDYKGVDHFPKNTKVTVTTGPRVSVVTTKGVPKTNKGVAYTKQLRDVYNDIHAEKHIVEYKKKPRKTLTKDEKMAARSLLSQRADILDELENTHKELRKLYWTFKHKDTYEETYLTEETSDNEEDKEKEEDEEKEEDKEEENVVGEEEKDGVEDENEDEVGEDKDGVEDKEEENVVEEEEKDEEEEEKDGVEEEEKEENVVEEEEKDEEEEEKVVEEEEKDEDNDEEGQKKEDEEDDIDSELDESEEDIELDVYS